jgi:hypothetical protein
MRSTCLIECFSLTSLARAAARPIAVTLAYPCGSRQPLRARASPPAWDAAHRLRDPGRTCERRRIPKEEVSCLPNTSLSPWIPTTRLLCGAPRVVANLHVRSHAILEGIAEVARPTIPMTTPCTPDPPQIHAAPCRSPSTPELAPTTLLPLLSCTQTWRLTTQHGRTGLAHRIRIVGPGGGGAVSPLHGA